MNYTQTLEKPRNDMDTREPSEPVKEIDTPTPSIKAPKPIKRWYELLGILMIVVVTPFFFVYDIFYVIPQLLGPFGVAVNGIVCTCISYNILGNMWACCRKTSEVHTLPPELLAPAKGEEHLWHYCEECRKLMPPRAWHCKMCKCCILKRDHHCCFTANCIGHNNQRFFIWLTFYLSLGAGLYLIYNLPFAWQHGFVFFFLWDFQEPDLLFRYSLTFVVFLNLFCFLMPIYMFFIEVSMVRKNTVMFDKSNHSYDLGVRRNFGQVLGHQGFWTCLSPAIKSRLPHVGTQWRSQASE